MKTEIIKSEYGDYTEYRGPQSYSDLQAFLEEILAKNPKWPRPKDWVVDKMIKNLVEHSTRYKTFQHFEAYVTNILESNYGKQIHTLTKKSVADWNKGRRKAISFARYVEGIKD
jgi:hypothetical protein